MEHDHLRAVFSLSAPELYEVLNYDMVLTRNKISVLDAPCRFLHSRNVILGAGFIEGHNAEALAKSILPSHSYPTCYLTVKLKPWQYLTAPSTILKPAVLYDETDSRVWSARFIHDAPDTAVVVGRVSRDSILKIETLDPEFMAEFSSLEYVSPKPPFWRSLFRRF